MARIMSVNYEAIPSQAKQMRETGKQLNGELTKAYSSIASMHSAWYGKRYNELVQDFNNMIPQLNEMLTLVVGEIPFALETIANNYAQADRGQNVVSAVKEAPNKISNIAITNDVGMKFVTAEVEQTQNSVVTNLRNAKDQMNQIEAQYGKVEWQSEASETFKTQLSKLKTSIVTSFENIESQFTRLMNQTKEDVQRTESANTVQ